MPKRTYLKEVNSTYKASRVLVIDIGGTNVKVKASDGDEIVKIPSGKEMTPEQMVSKVKEATADWPYDVVSIGYPGVVIQGRPLVEPRNLGGGWVGFDYEEAFGHPVKMINDAAMQALGSYQGGTMLFLGLGAGLGSAIVVDGMVESMYLAHFLYKNGKTLEEYVGARGLERLGKKKWRAHVDNVVERLKVTLGADEVVIGGGNVNKLKELPLGVRRGDNAHAFVGGVRMGTDGMAIASNRGKSVQRESSEKKSDSPQLQIRAA